jgi:hypothetical protein
MKKEQEVVDAKAALFNRRYGVKLAPFEKMRLILQRE